MTLFRVHDANTARSAATRAAIESVVFAPRNPEVRVSIDEHGAEISAVTPTL